MNNKKHVCIFGGSFNPIHNAHLEYANRVFEDPKYKIDELWLMPCFSAKSWGKNIESADHRIDMCRLAMEDNKHNFRVSDLEIAEEFLFTYQTAQYLRDNYKNIKFSWLVGSDWKGKEFKNHHIIEECGVDIICDDSFKSKIRSTIIRKRIERKNALYKKMISEKVCDYINKYFLYYHPNDIWVDSINNVVRKLDKWTKAYYNEYDKFLRFRYDDRNNKNLINSLYKLKNGGTNLVQWHKDVFGKQSYCFNSWGQRKYVWRVGNLFIAVRNGTGVRIDVIGSTTPKIAVMEYIIYNKLLKERVKNA
jgi:nicotinic acid mononucleotide adenylyltransferase